jgi:tRNA1(Val) A37 N6-methylase TrmN6
LSGYKNERFKRAKINSTLKKEKNKIKLAIGEKMILRFTKTLDNLDVFANGKELARIMGKDKDEKGNRVYDWPESEEQYVASFQDPVLVTDLHKIALLEPSLRDTVNALYGSAIKRTEYEGVSVRFDSEKYAGVWGPSIDTLLFCRALGKTDLSGVRSAVEIGPGSGFISMYALKNSPALEKISLVDINPNVVKCVADNISDPRVEVHIKDGLEFLEGKKFDLAKCNPPYIIRPKSIDDNPYEGIGLLVQLIERSREYLNPGGKLITNISSLSGETPIAMLQSPDFSVRELDKMTVPLKVFNVLNNKEWLNYLLSHGLKKQNKEGYDYWHTITVYEISPKK